MSQMFRTRTTSGTIIWDDYENVIYVAKGGADTNSGKNIETPKLTFGAAITAAAAETPSPTKKYAIVCLDDGIYAENITMGAFVDFYAPNAKIEGTVGIVGGSHFTLRELAVAGATTGITFTGTSTVYIDIDTIIAVSTGVVLNTNVSGTCYFKSNSVTVGIGTCFILTAGNVHADVQKLHLAGGTGVSINGAVQFTGSFLTLNGTSNGTAISTTTPSARAVVSVGSMETLNTGVVVNPASGSAEVILTVGDLSAVTAYSVGANGILRLTYGSMAGTQTSTGRTELNTGIATLTVTGATAMVSFSSYVADLAGGVAFTLPLSSGTAVGEIIEIVGKTGLWSISQNANQQILLGKIGTTVGVGGSVTALDASDCVELKCITGGVSSVWRIVDIIGDLTIV